MCLSVAVNRPNDVLATGMHAGHQWAVVHNGRGYRCGYVKVEPSHPWHGKQDDEIDADVHGGLTFAQADVPCDKGGDDDGWWLGFDCQHDRDAPDPELPTDEPPYALAYLDYNADARLRGTVRSQAYVEAECKRLCEQAANVSPPPGT